MVEWTVQQLARRAGISGRTLRHYHRIGLLLPDRIGTNGYRYYAPPAVARLQRILLFRDAGFTLSAIAEVLDAEQDASAEIAALQEHLRQLEGERHALERRIESVRHTLQRRREGRQPHMDMMLEGFNDRYEAEVTARWGRAAYEASNKWWHAKTLSEQRTWQADAEELLATWGRIHRSGQHPSCAEAQEHAEKHLRWFAQIPGTPTHEGDAPRAVAMINGMANLYATNPDFYPAFGGQQAAEFAAEALRLHVNVER